MAARKDPQVIIRGIDKVIKKDLEKHKAILDRTQNELLAFRQSVSYLISRRKYYSKLRGQGKYDDEALTQSMEDLKVDLRQMSDKVKLTQDAIAHHSLIVETLTQQLDDYYEAVAGAYNGPRN